MNLDEADALAFGVQAVDGFFDDFAGRTHADDHAVSLGIAHVLEEVMLTSGEGSHLLHVGFHDGGHAQMIAVGGFDVLEIDVGVLGGAAGFGVLGVHTAGAEFSDGIPGHELADIVVIDDFDLLNFMRSAEAVEEVQHGDAGFDGGKVGDQSEIHAFLDGVRAEHGEAGLTAGHDVLMIAEDAQGMAGESAGSHMEDGGQKLAGHLVHVGDHEEQALGGRVGGSQRAAGKHAMHGTGGTGLGLHLSDGHGLAENVLDVFGSHVVDNLAHDRGRGDGVDGGSVRKRVRDPRGSGVAVHGFHLCHVFPPKKQLSLASQTCVSAEHWSVCGVSDSFRDFVNFTRQGAKAGPLQCWPSCEKNFLKARSI